MSVDKMSVDKMSVDKMSVDKIDILWTTSKWAKRLQMKWHVATSTFSAHFSETTQLKVEEQN